MARAKVDGMAGDRKRVLMFAEAVTLAHVARPLALARALDPARYDVTIACDPRYAHFTAGGHWQQAALSSIPSAQFTQALANGTPVYDLATLDRYVAQDRALIAAHKPDVVVGDFRLSLSVSARLAQRPYLTIANAYWSPHYRGGFKLPVLPLTRALPLPLASALFFAARPVAFALHCRPMNQLRVRHGLPSLGHDLRRVYTDADHHLVPDVAALFPLAAPPGSPCSHVGPLMWSPDVALPVWWHEPVPDGQATVYVTLGSSGPAALLAQVLEALAGLPVRVLAASAGAAAPPQLPANARIADYLPGDAAAARAQLVVCNGGSLTVQQALAAGVPVLGLASNMDQFMNMAPIEAAGAGVTLRSDRISPARIRMACERLLATPAARTAAQRLQPLLTPPASIAEAFGSVLAAVSARC
jgi:UDP:flavonoid glycosyltransferase YjiC (YdhE family)